jgi:hypothetical protein
LGFVIVDGGGLGVCVIVIGVPSGDFTVSGGILGEGVAFCCEDGVVVSERNVIVFFGGYILLHRTWVSLSYFGMRACPHSCSTEYSVTIFSDASP